jgi:FG-GAP repeat/FG-GAP-like repeat
MGATAMIVQIRLLVSLVVGVNAFFLLDHAGGPPSPNRGVDPAVVLSGAGEGWWNAVTAQIAREEYSATSGAEGLQAPNRAHNLRTHFHERGIAISPRVSEAGAGWRFGWETAWFGRPGVLRAVGGARPEPNGSRVTYRRAAFDEWYDNSHEGIEQGFIVHDRPAGTGPLCLAGRIVGSLRAEMSSDEGAVDLLDEHGARVMRYAELKVWDAEGRAVPSHLKLDGAELAILVDDEGAAYPLTVDPLMTSPAWTVESNQVGAALGISVATAGDVNGDGYSDVVVGAHQYDNGQSNEGRAYVYHGSPTGLSTTPAWTAENNQAESRFGSGVATAGDVNGDGFSDVIVGADQHDNVQANEGRAYVYHGSAAGLAAAPAWTAEPNQAGASFGSVVAPAGDVNGDGFSDVIVGARFYDNLETDEGRAFVYHGSAAGLAATPAWTGESSQESAVFGNSVGTAGDVNGDGFSDIVVGAAGYDSPESGEGRAYVFHGSGAGLASAPAWTAESNQANASFGFSVATAGDVNGDGFSDVIVGASNYDNGHSNEGRASVYHGSGAGLAAAPAWTSESNQVDARFGNAVATAGDVNGDGFADVIIGARSYDNGETDEGRAFVYQGSAAGLAATAAWTAEPNQGFGELGISVATAGDVNGDGFSDVVVGAHLYDNGQADEGRALVYHGAAAGLATSAAWTAEPNQDNAFFGASVATAGDVNGDGFSDVIVAAYLYDNGQTDEGRVFVYHGSASGLGLNAAWTAESNQANSRFGVSVGTAGDVNGDGYADVIVGAYFYDNGQNDEGRAFVYHGSAAGLASSAAWTGESNQAVAHFGLSAATAGDVNGDGYSDVIVGSDFYDNEEMNEGRAFVYHGSAAGLAPTPAWTAESDLAVANFGNPVATAGDVNGDGFSDVIVGAEEYSDPELGEGKAFVYHGSSTGLATSPAWTAEGNLQDVGFGDAVGTAGDVNGDGYSDVVVGASEFDNGHDMEGRAFVYHGTAAGLNTTPAWTAESNQINARFGCAVATAGDVNGDGYSDVIVGAQAFDNGHTNEGRAFVYHGSAAGLAASPAWTGEPNQDGAIFGASVASAGDVNGDGFGDVIVGASSYVNGQTLEGRAFLYYGNGGPGRRMQLRQQRTDGMTPIAPLGRSDSETQFRIAATMLSVFGRTRLQMEHEVKPRGELLDGLNTTPGGFNDTGNDGQVNFGRLVSGLDPGTKYHWRIRAKYDLVKTPFQRNGPWVQVPLNGWNEADLNTSGTTLGLVQADASPPALQILHAPRPNPFASSAEIAYTLPADGRVRLAVYDVTGREHAVLVDAVRPAGRQRTTWNGRGARGGASLPAGVYFVCLEFAGRVETQKLALVP